MILLKLFWEFLKASSFTFGGAYGSIPLIRDMVLSNGWLSEAELGNMIAVSESTPGPIMVNLATYIGSTQAGFPGAVTATVAVVLPAYLAILLVTGILKNAIRNPHVRAVLAGLTPCVIGIVLATGVCMVIGSCVPAPRSADLRSLLLTVLLAGSIPLYQHIFKKKLSPIMLILLSACLGMIIY